MATIQTNCRFINGVTTYAGMIRSAATRTQRAANRKTAYAMTQATSVPLIGTKKKGKTAPITIIKARLG